MSQAQMEKIKLRFFCVKSLTTPLITLVWFVLNIAMGNMTKFLYRSFEFRHAYFVTMIHMVASSILCFTYLSIRGQVHTFLNVKLFLKVLPLSLCFTLSVSCGNLALAYIYPSFGQMLTSIGPLITISLATVFFGARFNRWSYMSLPIISSGILLCVFQETHLDWLGVIFSLTATVLRGIKSIVQGQLLQSSSFGELLKDDKGTPRKLNAVELLFLMAPSSALLLCALSIFFEGAMPYREIVSSDISLALVLVLAGINACLLNLVNFLVTFYTGAVTLQVLGNVKVILGVIVSAMIFGNPIAHSQKFGCALSLFGVWVYQSYGKQLTDVDAKSKKGL